MPPSPHRITTRRLMALVAIIALAFAGLRCHSEFGYSTSKGRHTSVLPIGTAVVAIEAIRVGPVTLDVGIP